MTYVLSLMSFEGMQTACVWYANGARTLEDVLAGKGGIKLTAGQEIGIRYYDGKLPCLLEQPVSVVYSVFVLDINERMPRSEAEAIFKKIEKIGMSSLR